MLDEDQAREIALRAIDRLGGVEALERLYTEGHEPYPEHEYVIEDQRVVVRLRDRTRPPTVYIGPYTFELRRESLVNITTT